VSLNLRRPLQLLLQVQDSPHRVALSFAIGVFIAFSPLLGIHTGIALAIAVLFRLSKVAILAGTWTNNPWTLAPMFMAGTALGCALFGVSAASLDEIDWTLSGRAFYDGLWHGLRPLVLPFVVGNTLLGIVAGGLSYVLLRSVLERRQVAPAPPA
jgi:uncharacterized protein (DUF2062 family)